MYGVLGPSETVVSWDTFGYILETRKSESNMLQKLTLDFLDNASEDLPIFGPPDQEGGSTFGPDTMYVVGGAHFIVLSPRKMANLNVFCLILRIDVVNTCKNAFLGHFLEFEWYVFAYIAQDDTFYC